MRRRLYFDTSVFGGVFDEEFSVYSIQLFERVKRGELVCLFSDVVDDELRRAPKRVRDLAENIHIEHFEYLNRSDETQLLAATYINAKVVGLKSYEDCLHIAFSTIHRADFLISWNFKHIVNDDRIKRFNEVNLSLGYQQISICSPKQFASYEKQKDEKDIRHS